MKASRYLTHVKRLREMREGVKRFLSPLEPLDEAGKLGPILWQLPANFHRDEERLAGALESLPVGQHCFEFRHASWFCEEVYGLLRAHEAALVVGDHPERPFQPHMLTTDWTLVRFHYGGRGRGGNYSATEITRWRRRLSQWRRRATIFAYFNNDWKGYAVGNALRLRDGPKARLPA